MSLKSLSILFFLIGIAEMKSIKTSIHGSKMTVETCDKNISNSNECTFKDYDISNNHGISITDGEVSLHGQYIISSNGTNINIKINDVSDQEELCPSETNGIIAINNNNNKVKNCVFDSITGSLTIDNKNNNVNTITINNNSKEIRINSGNDNNNKLIINGNSENIIVNHGNNNNLEITIAGNSEKIIVDNKNNNVNKITVNGDCKEIQIKNGHNNENEVTIRGRRGLIRPFDLVGGNNVMKINAPNY